MVMVLVMMVMVLLIAVAVLIAVTTASSAPTAWITVPFGSLETPKLDLSTRQRCQRYFLIIYNTRISNIDIIEDNIIGNLC